MLKNKIAYKLTFYIILLSALIILLTAIVQLYVSPLITNAISILLFALIIGWIFHTLVFRHLKKIADYAERLDLDTVLSLDRPPHVDELERIVNSINQLCQRESNAQNLLDAALLGLALWRFDGKLVTVNPAYAQIIGRELEETLQLNYWDDIVVEEDVAAEKWQLQALKVGEHYGPLEKEYRHKDGYHVPVKLSALILEKEGEYYVWSHIEDLSRQKWEARELQQAKQKAEDTNIAKSQFIANMSYELRTCMNTIVGYTEMLEEDCDQPIMRQDIKNVHVATKQLLGLIDSILDISQIEVSNMPSYSERFDLKTVIQNTVATLHPLIENKANALRLLFDKDLGEMYTDLIKVRQILFNLLSNASKFTELGIITLEVRRQLEENGDWITIRVSDEGSGMTSEQQADLYQVFTQGDASNTRKYGSTGLGLSLTKQFAHMLGGTLNLEGVFDKGNHFTVRLPAHMTTPKPHEAIVRESPQESAVVLVIDDDEVVREMLEVYLSKVGYQVAVACSGEEGLKLAKKLRPDAITLDVMMPGMDGWEVLSKLKAEPELAHIPVIMLTMTEAQEIGYSLGAAEYITKPVSKTQLINVLRKYRTEKAPYSVMVVEDDQFGREMMVRMLEHVGWQVIEAGNGSTALQLLQKHQPDLILSDLTMPDMDGFEFITHLRQHQTCSSTLVVVVTAKLLTPEEELWLNNRVDAVFQKGTYRHNELLAKLRQLLVGAVGDKSPTTN
ncbi:MAG: response regulator [Pseudomonadota bacterium]